jgi:secondary thiamine-phosphate synthase enzyme
MRTARFSVDTRDRVVVDITEEVSGFAGETGGEGLLHVFFPHATAGVVLMETGAGSEQDLADSIERLLPRQDGYAHRHGSSGHGADHLLPAFLSSSLVLSVSGGRPVLGTWQRVALVDTNRENNSRTVLLSFLSG